MNYKLFNSLAMYMFAFVFVCVCVCVCYFRHYTYARKCVWSFSFSFLRDSVKTYSFFFLLLFFPPLFNIGVTESRHTHADSRHTLKGGEKNRNSRAGVITRSTFSFFFSIATLNPYTELFA